MRFAPDLEPFGDASLPNTGPLHDGLKILPLNTLPDTSTAISFQDHIPQHIITDLFLQTRSNSFEMMNHDWTILIIRKQIERLLDFLINSVFVVIFRMYL